MSRYQKGKTNLDFTEARDSEWQWHQLGHIQVCTSCQTDNHASTPPLCFYRPDALPPNQQRQSTEGSRIKSTNTLDTENNTIIFCDCEQLYLSLSPLLHQLFDYTDL